MAKANYRVLPLPVAQKWARKELSRSQLRAGIKLARQLRFYPDIPDLESNLAGMAWNYASNTRRLGSAAGYVPFSGSMKNLERFTSWISSGRPVMQFPRRTNCELITESAV